MKSVRQPKRLCLRLKTSAVTDVTTAQTATATSATKRVEMPLNKKPPEDARKENPDASSRARPADASTTKIIRTGGC